MHDKLFSRGEQAQYSRHFLVNDFGVEGQACLKAGKV
jgi:molybdopterin/thiamine biosynthesis adenylyltransferase